MSTRRPALAVVALAAAVSGCAIQQRLTALAIRTSPAAAAAAPVTPTDPSPVGAGATVSGRPPAAYPAGRPGVPAGGLPAASTLTSADPDVVARAALTATWTSDTTLDSSPADAARRALRWLGGTLARTVAAATPPTAPGATWNTWAAHHAHTVVTVTPISDDHPPDTTTTADRQYQLTATPTGPGWHGTPETVTVYAELTRTGHTWRVTELGQQPWGA